MSAALAMMQRSERVDYQRMAIRRLRELARQQHPEHTDEAARAFVMRALDMEVERRTVLAHENVGWHNHSPGAPGIGVGGTDIAREPLAHIADRWQGTHDAHEYVASWLRLARLPERQLLAALIQAAKTDRRVPGPWAANYDQIAANLGHYAQLLGWAPGSSAGHTFECIEDKPRPAPGMPPPHERVTVPRNDRERRLLAEHYEQAQQGPRTTRQRTSHRVPVFKNGQALKDAAKAARIELILMAQLG